MNEELDSQLSAMFDDELPEQQCELLAKRLARDDALKARWGRYAAIGAAIRSEKGIRLDGNVARRVSAAISSEAPLSVESEQPVQTTLPKVSSRRAIPWWQPAVGVGVAASVAVISIFWLRAQSPGVDSETLAQTGTSSGTTAVVESQPQSLPEPDSYTVPINVEPPQMMPASAVAKYVVAHSEFSTPLNRRFPLSALVATESGTATGAVQSEEQAEDSPDNAP